MYPTEGHNKWVNQSLNNSGWRRHFQVNWFNSLPKAQLTSTLHSVLKFKHTIFFSSPLTTHLQNYVAPSFFSQPALPSGPHVHHLMSPAGKAATNLQSPKCSGAAAPNVNPLFGSLSTCSLEWFLLHSKASWERLDPARLPYQWWWLTSCMETALPSSSSDPQASRRPNTSIHSCQCPAQCDPTTWSWRQTFLPICTVLAQKCNRHCFLSQHAGGGGGKMAFLFYSPRNQENPSWTYGAHDFGEGESLNTLLIPWCQRDCQILPVPIHTSCIFYLTFFFFGPEIACMKFWQAWQHHVSSKAFQHKQEKITKNGSRALLCDSLRSSLYATLHSGLANSSNFYAKAKLSRLWPSALQKVGRVLDSLFDSPPLEIGRTALWK